MQGDNNAGDFISRAKAKVAAWRAEKDAQQRACRFDNHSDEELVRVLETGRALDGQRLTGSDYYALHGAWQAAFGEGLGNRPDRSESLERSPQVHLGEHPLMALPDDKMLRPRDVVRLCGIPKTTLKRWGREGRFPKSQRISPLSMPRHVGWPAREIKEWLRSTWH